MTDDHIYLVVNAGCREKDLAHLGKHLKPFQDAGKAVGWHIHDERSLLALQGPLAPDTLQKLTKEDLSKMYFGDFKIIDINGSECFLTRTGYDKDFLSLHFPIHGLFASEIRFLSLDLIEQHSCGGNIAILMFISVT